MRWLVPNRLIRTVGRVLLLVIVAGCQRRPEPPRAPPLNLLIVTFDTTRADRLGCYGATRARTPVLDKLAAEGARFAHALAAAPITLPSHATLFTGRYPLAHGVRDNGLFSLADAETTLAEILRGYGYTTGAAVGSYPLSARFGLAQGFDFYDDRVGIAFEDFDGRRVVPKTRLFFDERRAARVNDAFLGWLEVHLAEQGHRPFFGWVHYFDPHQPFEPPPPYNQTFADDPYQGEIAYADESLGTLLGHLERLGLTDRTLILVAGDHGEGLGDHEEVTHSLLNYETTLHVPLIIRGPGVPRATVIERRVGLVDVVPTVLELLGRTRAEGIQGESLVPLLAGEARSAPPYYAETVSPRLAQGWGELRTLYWETYKYIHGPRPELFDLEVDPRERADISHERPNLAHQMREQLSRFMADHAGTTRRPPPVIDPEVSEHLAALGYLQGSVDEPPVITETLSTDGTAPQDRVVDVAPVSRVKQALFTKRFLVARDTALELVKRDPENRYYLSLLAGAQAGLGLIDDALWTYRRIEELSPGEPTRRLLTDMAAAYRQKGQRAEAVSLMRRSEQRRQTAGGQYQMGVLLAAEGDQAAAALALGRALELDPAFVPARVERAVLLARQGAADLATADFERAIRDQPYFAKAYYNYGTFLLSRDEHDRALARFERALQIEPGYLQAQYALIALYLRRGEKDRAQALFADLEAKAPEHDLTQQARRVMEATP